MSTTRLLMVLITLSITTLLAQVPQTLSYQGLLTDQNGVPVDDGSYAVTFRFYSAATGGIAIATRGPLTVNTFKGLFTNTLGDGTTDNAVLPFTFGDQELFVGITVSPSTTELTPRIRITAVPYAFVANTVKNLDAGVINTGTLPPARIADGSITDAKLASGIDPAKLAGTVSVANGGTGASNTATARTNLGLGSLSTLNAVTATEITDGTIGTIDIADGAVTNNKINSVDAAKITGVLPITGGGTGANNNTTARTNLGLAIGTNVQAYDADLDDLADGSLSGSKVGTGISASNITTGTLSGAVVLLTGTNVSKVASGTTAERVGPFTEGQIRYNSSEKVMEYYNGTNWYWMSPRSIILKDVKPDATDGGFATAIGSWQTRELNTSEPTPFDPTILASFNSNQLTLLAGEYIIEASAPSVASGENRIRLFRVGDPITTSFSLGPTAYAQAGEFSRAVLKYSIYHFDSNHV